MGVSLVEHVMQGKTLARYLFNREVLRHSKGLKGKALDIAGAHSYQRFLPAELSVLCTNINPSGLVVDFEKQLPFADANFDVLFFFNALYIVHDPTILMREIQRVVRPGGTVLIASPFLQNEMREPHDYRRLTSEGLRELFVEAGFSKLEIIPYGERFSVATNLLHPVWYFNAVRLLVYPLALMLDRWLPFSIRSSHPAPLGYFCVITNV